MLYTIFTAQQISQAFVFHLPIDTQSRELLF